MKFTLSILFIFVLNVSLLAQKNTFSIDGTIRGVENSEVYLAHYFGSSQQVIKDTAQADASGHFTFSGKEELPKGLYLISFNKSKYIDFIIGNTSFSFQTDTLDLVGNMTIKGSAENEAFYTFQQQMSAKYKALMASNSQDATRKKMIAFQQEWVEKNKLLFVSKLIKATFEPEIPAYTKVVKTAQDSSALYQYQYAYYKKHYFESIDLNDERMIRTPFLQKKLEKYFEDLVVQVADSISKDADRLIAKIKNPEVRKYVVYKISSTYENHNIIGTDAAFVHMAEKYYIGEPALWDTSTVRRMKERIKIIKPLLIGKRIPEMFLTDPAGKMLTLSAIPATYTIAFIYDPDCSHCKEETPKLIAQKDYFKTKNIAILAACITRDKDQWKKFIAEFNIGTWYNGIDVHIDPKTKKEVYYTDFRNTFDAYSTPVVYILDKSKNIIGKKIPVDKIQDFIGFYESQRKKN